MNTMKPLVAENGRVPNDSVIILDAGAQYGKVRYQQIIKGSILIIIYFRSSTERFESCRLSQRFYH